MRVYSFLTGNISSAVDCRIRVRATCLAVTACHLNNFKIKSHCNSQGPIRGVRSAGTKSWVFRYELLCSYFLFNKMARCCFRVFVSCTIAKPYFFWSVPHTCPEWSFLQVFQQSWIILKFHCWIIKNINSYDNKYQNEISRTFSVGIMCNNEQMMWLQANNSIKTQTSLNNEKVSITQLKHATPN